MPEKTHNRIVSSTRKTLIQGVLKSWSTKKSTNIQTRLVFGAPEKHKKKTQSDRFEHKKSTIAGSFRAQEKHKKTHKHTNTFGFWSTRKAQEKNTIGSFRAQEKHNSRIVSSTRKAQKNTQTYKHVWVLEHKKCTKKHNRIVSSTRKAQQKRGFCDRNLLPGHASQY